jgi:hypothetical protein
MHATGETRCRLGGEGVPETACAPDRPLRIGRGDEHVDVGHGTHTRAGVDAVRQRGALEKNGRNAGVGKGLEDLIDARFAGESSAAMAACQSHKGAPDVLGNG